MEKTEKLRVELAKRAEEIESRLEDLEAKVWALDEKKLPILDLVAEQKAAGRLWFGAKTVFETSLQSELRRLHAVIDANLSSHTLKRQIDKL